MSKPSITPSQLFRYKAYVARVHDGNTVTLDIDLGLGLWRKGVFATLHRLSSPDMKGPAKEEGTAARDYLRSLILDREVLVRTTRAGQGQYGAEIVVAGKDGHLLNVNDAMVAAGHATRT